jgi:hypothetical protein
MARRPSFTTANFKRNPENKRPTVQVVGRDTRVTIVTIAIAATFAATRARIRVV